MTDRYASVHIEVDPSRAAERAPVEIEARPFHLLLIGDFSGRGSRDESRAGLRLPQPLPVDRDDFDAVLARLAPRVRLTLDTDLPPLDIQLRELEDFHPDGLFARAPLFAQLRELRRRVLDPRETAGVAAELGHGAGAEPAPPQPATRAQPTSAGGLLDLIVAETAPAQAGVSVEAVLDPREQLSTLVRGLVRPHLVARPDPRQADLLRSIDGAVTAAMRRILHHAGFQSTEALWRSLLLLVRSVETSPLLKIDLLDVTAAELGEALTQQAWVPGASTLGVTPALLVVLHPVAPDDSGMDRLRLLARTAATIGAACVTGVPPELVGIPGAGALDEPERWESPPSAWADLRGDPAADHLAAALPRFLLRLPYGEDSDECESFSFEELDESAAAADFLWGSAAIGSAILLARAFTDSGWSMRAGIHRELDGLPLPILRSGGEVTARQAAETPLPDAAAEALLERGVIPFVAMRDRGVVRVPRIQSIADPPAPLAGPWAAT